MNKKQLDEISLLCRKHKIPWQTGKDSEGYSVNIDLSLTTGNYPLLVALFKEYERQNPVKPDEVTAYQNLFMLQRKEKKRRGTSGNWGENIARDKENWEE